MKNNPFFAFESCVIIDILAFGSKERTEKQTNKK